MYSKIKEFYEDFISCFPECIENSEYIHPKKYVRIYSK